MDIVKCEGARLKSSGAVNNGGSDSSNFSKSELGPVDEIVSKEAERYQ